MKPCLDIFLDFGQDMEWDHKFRKIGLDSCMGKFEQIKRIIEEYWEL